MHMLCIIHSFSIAQGYSHFSLILITSHNLSNNLTVVMSLMIWLLLRPSISYGVFCQKKKSTTVFTETCFLLWHSYPDHQYYKHVIINDNRIDFLICWTAVKLFKRLFCFFSSLHTDFHTRHINAEFVYDFEL